MFGKLNNNLDSIKERNQSENQFAQILPLDFIDWMGISGNTMHEAAGDHITKKSIS